VNGVAGQAFAIAAGSRHACAARAPLGDIVCWGSNQYGESAPPNVYTGYFSQSLAAGATHTLALTVVPEPDALLLGDVSVVGLLTIHARARMRRCYRHQAQTGMS
jgi:hypothetical protein